MNLGTLLLGVLLVLLLLRASYLWFVEDASHAWYRNRSIDWLRTGTYDKPWYVRRYDRMWARRRTS